MEAVKLPLKKKKSGLKMLIESSRTHFRPKAKPFRVCVNGLTCHDDPAPVLVVMSFCTGLVGNAGQELP